MAIERGSSTVMWPSPLLQVLGGGGLVAYCVYCFVDILKASDMPTGVQALYGSAFVVVGVVGFRLLVSRAIVRPSEFVAIGVMGARRFERSEVTAVSTETLGYGGKRLALTTTTGESLLPMAVSGTRRQREAMASILRAWLVEV